MGQLSQGSGLSGNVVHVTAALFETLMSESSFGNVYGRVVPEKCALSHGSGVLGRDPRNSCRFWSPHVENVCTVTQIRLGEGGGGIPLGGGGRRTENRDHIYIYIYMYSYM